MRLNESHEMPPKASGVMNSVASTSPNRSTTVSQMIEDRNQCFAAWSVNGEGRPARWVNGAGAVAVLAPSWSDIEGRRYDLAGADVREMTKLPFLRLLHVSHVRIFPRRSRS